MALYHTHRPQTFDSIIGQEHIVQTIQNQIKQDNVGHAYLFSGPRGVGKTTTARILAKAVNCPLKEGSAEPDNESECAKEINESRSIDVIEIDAASHTGVDNVRQNIIENAQFKPTKLNKKVFIIDEVHMLSTAAFNALLKTLEEPPEHVLFVLATTELHKLPITIVSRCQRFEFKRVPHALITEHLAKIATSEKKKVDEAVLSRIAHKSEGCVRDAISLLDQILSSEKKTITLDDVGFILPTSHIDTQLAFMQALVDKNAGQAFTLLTELKEGNANITMFMNELIELIRTIMISQIDTEHTNISTDLTPEQQTQVSNLAASMQSSELVLLIDKLIERKQHIPLSPRPELPLEILIIDWTGDTKAGVTTPEEQTNSEEKKPPQDPPPTPPTSNTPPPEPTSPTPQEEPVAPISASSADISLASVQSKWSAIISAVEKQYPSLGFIFKTVTLSFVSGNTITIAVQYPFHEEKLSEKTCSANIEQIMEDTLGSGVTLAVILSDSAQEVHTNTELNELASAFGGEVVN